MRINQKIKVGNKMEIIVLDDFLKDGILKEKNFREEINGIDWGQYANCNVLIKGCSQATIPTWAYLIITARLTEYAKNIYYGDVRSAIKVS
tara:strand:+ start:1701 stop:1973 length:273 start_codon:yes stop_codon:yes gene_type:complete